MGGPYWAAPIHDQEVVDKLLERANAMQALIRVKQSGMEKEGEEDKDEEEREAELVLRAGEEESTAQFTDPLVPATLPRIRALLRVISAELKDVPLYYNIPDLCGNLHCVPPTSDKIRSAIANAGYRFSGFHHEPGALKTDAPPSVVWDILRAWCMLHPPGGSKHKSASLASKKILKNPPSITVDWTPVKQAKRIKYVHHEDGTKEKAIMFPGNPDDNWGPKRKHGTVAAKEEARLFTQAGELGAGSTVKKSKP